MMATITWEDLTAAVRGTPISAWTDAAPVISSTRARVDEFLASDGQAYGFSTLLGHLDSHRDATLEWQRDMFRAHLVGNPQPISLARFRGITAMKLSQLSQGASGISPEIYAAIISRFASLSDYEVATIDLAASYGSGDVVPAAWWTRAILGDDPDFDRGDVIALINGSFITTGLVLADYQDWYEIVGRILQALYKAQRKLGDSHVQLPVSLRDLSPLEGLIDEAFARLRKEIVHSANAESGNPVFTELEGSFRAVSNSSFLNFPLTSSINTFSKTLEACSAYLRSATECLASVGENRVGELIHGAYFVQPPKVSKAYFDHVHSLLNTSFPLAQSESHMVEDIGDTALARWRIVESSVELISNQLNILVGVLSALDEPAGKTHSFNSLHR